MEKVEKDRLDKWLWHARFYKTRSLAVQMIEKGKVRVNGQPIKKPGHMVRVGDVLTLVQGRAIRVIEICEFAERRGPAREAALLYHDRDSE